MSVTQQIWPSLIHAPTIYFQGRTRRNGSIADMVARNAEKWPGYQSCGSWVPGSSSKHGVQLSTDVSIFALGNRTRTVVTKSSLPKVGGEEPLCNPHIQYSPKVFKDGLGSYGWIHDNISGLLRWVLE
ncbi:hypothetical protein BO85DRAFT_141309 [Aspergillus piperis CBS 112811]|uniref:Uncharacterized protein n=1 Tax=Aspergillus piperis CBS 112811 TaxID=1448313 RepID=A0A8G1QTV4_9EURO|nr:hypothetical protein BO85DRAFT_141309 [Aspergillus piperis CBS 112811]RAH54206.1 hypothetical protein BO85DRAFT_141309 [Aspergillus piperis CBS 112811]